jgi:putative transposase
MARLARVVIPGLPHHLTQRGTRRQEIFFSDEDRRCYLELVGAAAQQFGVTIWAWCLMPNHVHFVARPAAEESLALCFGQAHTRYSRMINFRQGWRGFLFQGRFASSPMDWPYAYHAVRYVLRNPVRAGLVRLPWGYAWSSAAFQVGETKTDPLVKKDERLEEMVGDWRKYLCAGEDDEEVLALRRETSVGRSLGNRGFLRQLEARLDRHLLRRRPGRPPKGRNR